MKEATAESPVLSVPCAPDPLISLLLRTAHAIERRLDDALETVELSTPKYSALTKLVQADEPLALSELAARMTCVRSNITQLVDRLEADGLVHRVEDPRDRRSVRAALTPLGRQRQAAGEKRVAVVRAVVAESLAGIDRGVLERALAQLTAG
jgi:DNA-binding MarR family transcriptional regulator